MYQRNVLAGQIEAVLDQRGGKILESYELFDIYEGARSRKAISLWRILLYSATMIKTLEEAEITATMKKILNGLTDLGIELRS